MAESVPGPGRSGGSPLAAGFLIIVFDYLQGATGEELSRLRNADALKAIEIVPRYGIDISAASSKTTLFGREFSAPLAISPIGMDGAIWPGATRLLAEAAREAGIAYMQSSMATTPLEQAAAIAPDNFWFQLYGFPADDHAVTFDLVRRAREAGAHVLAVTLDIPGPARRVRDMRNGLGVPLRITPAMAIGTAIRPHWLAALARTGMPRFENFAPYCREGAGQGGDRRLRRQGGRAPASRGRRWRAFATPGPARLPSRVSCIRATRKRRCRSAPTA
jgi:(S)-mandelate dehydrogenase